MIAALAVAQLVVLLVIVARLLPGRRRRRPVQPRPLDEPPPGGSWPRGVDPSRVSVVVPVRNEAARIAPCLAGLASQGATMVEALIVDGASTDGTRALVAEAAGRDARIRLIDEPPRAAGVVGRPWAIAAGARAAVGDWVLVVDADVTPRRGMVAAVVDAAKTDRYDAVSFAPRIVAPGAGARWLQASFVITLVYRFGAAGADIPRANRAVANGQCLLIRRETLMRAGGYEVAARSFCDDVDIVRRLAGAGARVGFLDGPDLFDVLMYPTARETWRAWPRSLNMRDATTPAWRVLDALVLLLGQALPILIVAALLIGVVVGRAPATHRAGWLALAVVNGALLLLRLTLSLATAGSFASRGVSYWLAPLADPATALRVIATTFTRSREWRGGIGSSP